MMDSRSHELYCLIEQTWTITEEKLKEMKDSNVYRRIISEPKQAIAFPNVKYNIILSCQTANSGKRAFFIFLDLFKIGSRIHAKYSFFIKSENFVTQFNNVFFSESSGWGDEICYVAEFFDSRKKFIVNGKFIVEMKGILIFNDVSMSRIVATEASPCIQRLWKKDDKDFKIIVGNEGNVMIHKCILSARSDTFEAMFQSGRKEAQTNIELIRFADKYVINDLLDKLETYITYQLSPSTICELANHSIAANSIKL